jgi:hypothetical protein
MDPGEIMGSEAGAGAGAGAPIDDEFTQCMNRRMNLRAITTRIKSYSHYSDITENDISDIHHIMNTLMNLDPSVSRDCQHHTEECHKVHGFGSSYMSLAEDLVELVSGTGLSNESPEDDAMHTKLMDEIGSKIPPTMKHLVQLTKDHEEQTCGFVSDKTELLEHMYSGSTMTLELPDIDLLGISKTTDNYEFGRKLLTFISVSVIIYMFAQLLLK